MKMTVWTISFTTEDGERYTWVRRSQEAAAELMNDLAERADVDEASCKPPTR